MHCTDTLAFWLFVELIEECELRDIYQIGLPGLHKHSYIINMLVTAHLPELSAHFEEHNVQPQMYASDWIFSLFSSVLPETNSKVTASFFTQFFKYKWEFFYKLVLSILQHISPKLFEAKDMFSILQQIKIAMSNKNDPYNYSHAPKQSQLQGEQKSIEAEQIEEEEKEQVGIVDRLSSLFTFGNKTDEEWKEFPWEDIIVKQDIRKKWPNVDMR